MQQPQAGLELTADFHPLLFTLYLFPLKLVIDGGQPISGKWGVNHIPLTPGRHTISVHWLAYWFLPVNKAEMVIDVQQGQVAQLHYRARWIILVPGIMEQTGLRSMVAPQPGQPAAIPQTAAGWHPDPAGKHELRYWDGAVWTDDVSDAGVTTKDTLAS